MPVLISEIINLFPRNSLKYNQMAEGKPVRKASMTARPETVRLSQVIWRISAKDTTCAPSLFCYYLILLSWAVFIATSYYNNLSAIYLSTPLTQSFLSFNILFFDSQAGFNT
jgi:hypothetical protein